MSDSDNSIRVEYEDLIDLAQNLLIPMGDIFDGLKGTLSNRVDSDVSNVMWQPDRFGGSSSAAKDPWLTLSDQAVTFFGNTASVMKDTAAALQQAANLYKTTDEGSAGNFPTSS